MSGERIFETMEYGWVVNVVLPLGILVPRHLVSSLLLCNYFFYISISLFQKKNEKKNSKVCHNYKGGKNSKYFHVVINWRRRKSMLRDLSIDNLWVKDPVKVKEEALFFANRFSRNH